MVNDIILNKAAIIERCLKRIHEEYTGHENELTTNYTKQDAIILNIQRACEASIDLATHIIRIQKLGIPQSGRDVFEILAANHIISQPLSDNLQNMVSFRNIAVHDYTKLNIDIVKNIIEQHLTDFLTFTQQLLKIKS